MDSGLVALATPRNDTACVARPSHTRPRVPAACSARVVFEIIRPSKTRGRRECRVKASPMARQQQEKLAAVTTGAADHPAFPARWLTAYTRSPRGPAFLPPSSARRVEHRHRLGTSTGMPGPHDFAVRVRRVRLTRPPRPPLPASTLVTIGRNAPLHRGGMACSIVVICPTTQAHAPAANWHDGQFAHGGNAGRACRARKARSKLQRTAVIASKA
jgi:hypothetical protein